MYPLPPSLRLLRKYPEGSPNQDNASTHSQEEASRRLPHCMAPGTTTAQVQGQCHGREMLPSLPASAGWPLDQHWESRCSPVLPPSGCVTSEALTSTGEHLSPVPKSTTVGEPVPSGRGTKALSGFPGRHHPPLEGGHH